jgi:hypothetical protein
MQDLLIKQMLHEMKSIDNENLKRQWQESIESISKYANTYPNYDDRCFTEENSTRFNYQFRINDRFALNYVPS